MTWPAVKQAFPQEGFRKYVQELKWGGWRPQMIVWHNTAAPTLKQWMDSAARDRTQGLTPGITRIRNLEAFFRDNNGWSGCPHLFIAPDVIWVMNSMTAPGVHSPSWNSISWGIEMIADFDKEDDEAGPGAKVKLNTVFATTIMCEAVGLDPATAIKLHKEDKRTTHDCPGHLIAVDKLKMISGVQALMAGGEHSPQSTSAVIAGAIPQAKPERQGTTLADGLNFRVGPSASSESRGALARGLLVIILDEAANATTKWLKVRTPAGYIGWVAGKYVKENA